MKFDMTSATRAHICIAEFNKIEFEKTGRVGMDAKEEEEPKEERETPSQHCYTRGR